MASHCDSLEQKPMGRCGMQWKRIQRLMNCSLRVKALMTNGSEGHWIRFFPHGCDAKCVYVIQPPPITISPS